jgi:hypothetical protein
VTAFNPGNITMLSSSASTRTILYASIFDNTGAEQKIMVGGIPLIENFGGTQRMIQNNSHLVFSNKAVIAIKSNTATTTFQIVWVPRDRNLVADPTIDFATITPVTVSNWQFGTTTTILNWSSTTLSGLNILCTNCASTSTINIGTTSIVITPTSTTTPIGGTTVSLFEALILIILITLAFIKIFKK